MTPEDEEEVKRRVSFSHHGGAASALESAAATTRQMAGDTFAKGNDKEAESLRRFAVWLEGRALDERKAQKQYEPRFSGGI